MNKARQIVTIEDDPVFSEILAAMFRERDYRAFCFFNMEDALYGIPHLRPVLVVTDVFLPGMGGVDGIQMLKSEWPEQKVLAISGGWGGMSGEETLKAMKAIGADAGLLKPFGAQELDAALETLGLTPSKA